jgi:hypothetical protein
LHAVAPELDLFDTQGSLQQQSALVSQVLEVISDLEDEDVDPTGVILLEAPDRKGFRGFERPPFGWSSELVRLVLAASFRGGAIYVERPTPSGPAPLYDYKDSYDLFAKINTFKHVTFRVAETRLSVDQIKRANKELIAMGVTGTPESGNAIATAVRKLGETLKAGIQEARAHADRGLPIRDAVVGGTTTLAEPTTAKDPTKVVTAFLSHAGEWKSLHQSLEGLHAFEPGTWAYANTRRPGMKCIAPYELLDPAHSAGRRTEPGSQRKTVRAGVALGTFSVLASAHFQEDGRRSTQTGRTR